MSSVYDLSGANSALQNLNRLSQFRQQPPNSHYRFRCQIHLHR